MSDVLLNISSETFISEEESVDATHNRSISEPSLSMIFCGAITFPLDLDILLPLASTVNPCVIAVLYGTELLIATEVKRED